MYAAVQYLLWLRRSGTQDLSADAKAFFERILDPDAEGFIGMRVAVAHYLPQLAYLDRDWTISILPSLFPVDQTLSEHWLAAWDAYVRYAKPLPTPDVLSALEPYYKRAVEEIEPEYVMRSGHGDPLVSLGEHLVFMFLNNHWDLQHPVLMDFFHRAPMPVRVRILDWLGRGAVQEHPSEEWAERVRAFYEWREKDIDERGDDPAELRSIGWLAASKEFPVDWWKARLPAVFKATSHANGNYVPLEEMMAAVVAAAPVEPEMALDVLDLVIAQSEWGWHEPYLAAAESILDETIRRPQLANHARLVADRLARAGHNQFERFGGPEQ